MTVESATYISQLDNSYPAQSDSRTEGDDHIRLIKTTLANSFANFTGAAVTSTEAELNYVNVATLGTVEASKAVTANSSGNINFNNGDMTNVDINSGAIDGTTIGAAIAAAGTFTTMTATTVASTTLADGTVATTQTQGNNSTKVATTAYVESASGNSKTNFGGKVQGSDGSILSTYGEAWTAARDSAGTYTITPGTAVSDANDWIVTATSWGGARVEQVSSSTTTTFTLIFKARSDGTNTNTDFTFHVRVGS